MRVGWKGIACSLCAQETRLSFSHHIELSKLKKEYPNYYTLLYHNEIDDLFNIQELSSKQNNQWVIYFLTSSESFGAIIIGPDSINLYAGKNNLEYLQKNQILLSRHLNNKSWDIINPAANLYDTLFAPIKKFIHSENIVIGGFGVTRLIPFDLLVSHYRKSDDSLLEEVVYLVDEYNISFVYSGTLALESSQVNIL